MELWAVEQKCIAGCGEKGKMGMKNKEEILNSNHKKVNLDMKNKKSGRKIKKTTWVVGSILLTAVSCAVVPKLQKKLADTIYRIV